MTIENQFVDLLEEGYEVMADKGFPEIEQRLMRQVKQCYSLCQHFSRKTESSVKKQQLVRIA